MPDQSLPTVTFRVNALDGILVSIPLPEPDAHGWYPMNTAPETGVKINLLRKALWNGTSETVPNCSYIYGAPTYAGVRSGWREPDASIHREYEYSHWQPMHLTKQAQVRVTTNDRHQAPNTTVSVDVMSHPGTLWGTQVKVIINGNEAVLSKSAALELKRELRRKISCIVQAESGYENQFFGPGSLVFFIVSMCVAAVFAILAGTGKI